MLSSNQFVVTATSLNLRSQPIAHFGNRLAVLPQGHIVTKLNNSTDPAWWEVSTTLSGSALQGFVAHQYLSAAPNTGSSTVSGISVVHLPVAGRTVARNQTNGRAYPLNESGQPNRSGSNPVQKKSELTQIITWLDVDSSIRYKPGNNTFCNIYAYDYCYLAEAYMPRVWWTQSTLIKLTNGQSVPVQYGTTVNELNANSLTNWFEQFGTLFGWSRSFDITQLQQAANNGQVCIIVAQKRNLNSAGHICAVVPETSSHTAKYSGTKVTVPLQSQAGRVNFAYGGNVWWTDSKFQKFGFWIHA